MGDRNAEGRNAEGRRPGDTAGRQRVLISACLLGERCRYNAVQRQNGALRASGDIEWVPVCPEVLGGLPTPRPAATITSSAETPGDTCGAAGGAEVLDGRARVVDETGADVTSQFLEGARKALARAEATGVARAVLKSRSPSCGVGALAAGTDSTRLGNGVFAELLRRQGIQVESADFDVLSDPDLKGKQAPSDKPE